MKLIAWTIPEESAAQVIAMVKFRPGAVLTPEHHLHLLVDRLQGLINLAEDPEKEARLMESRMEEEGLLYGYPRKWQTAAWDLLVGNPRFQELLMSWEIPEQLPKGPVHKTNKEAELIREEEDALGISVWVENL